MAHTFNDCQQEYCDKCSSVQLVSQISPSPHFSVVKCPLCNFKIYKCRYCFQTRIIRRRTNDHRKIKKHVEKNHPEILISSRSPGIQQSLVLNDTVAFKFDDSVTNTCGGLANDGTETETEFLGHNEPSDENHVSHLVESMCENNSDSQCNSYEYSSPRLNRKFVNLDSFKYFSNNEPKAAVQHGRPLFELRCRTKRSIFGHSGRLIRSLHFISRYSDTG